MIIKIVEKKITGIKIKSMLTLFTVLLVILVQFINCIIVTKPAVANPGYENWLTYTEVDPSAYLTVATNQITFTNMPGTGSCTVYSDKGAGYFGALFTHEFDARATSYTGTNWNTYVMLHALANVTNINKDVDPLITVNGKYGGASDFRVYLVIDDGATDLSDVSVTLTPSTTYYFTLDRNISDIDLYIYNDAARTSLKDTLTVASPGTSSFRYVHNTASGGTVCTDTMSGDVYNLELNTGSPTTIGALTLAATFECISVYSNFTGDTDENNSTVMEWRESGGSWKQGIDLTEDRRDTFLNNGTPTANPYDNQYRGSIFGLTANTSYEVRVTYTDPDGVSGTNPVSTNITTRNDSFPLGSGNTYYVATSGNDTNPGTIGSPWLTIQHAADSVVAGDTVYIRSGIYYETPYIYKSGVSDNYITFMNYNSENVTIDCGNVDNGTLYYEYTGGVRFYNQSTYAGVDYVHWSGINVRNAYHCLILLYNGANYNVIENCTLYDFGYQNPGAAISVTAASNHNLLQNLKIYSDRDDYGDSLHRAGGFCVWKGPSFDPGRTNGQNAGNVFRNNYIDGLGLGISDGIGGIENEYWWDGPFKDCDIYNNIILNYLDDGVEAEGADINVRAFSNFMNSADTTIFGTAPCSIGPLYLVRNVGRGDFSVGHKNGDGSAYDGTIYCYHNTYYKEKTGGYIVNNSGGNNWKNEHYLNNILKMYGTSYNWFVYVPNSGYNNTFDYDLMYSTSNYYWYWIDTNYSNLAAFQAASLQETHGVWGAATFVDPGSDNFSLQEGSEGINDGILINGINDADSPWPYYGIAPDIGAYEYYPAAPSVPSVTTSAATSVEETTATLNGNITSTGNSTVDYRGFEWDTNTGAPYSANWTESGSFGTGAFSHAISSLTKGELYYYRAIAHNSLGWGYGSEVTFLTKPDEPNTFTATSGDQQVLLSWSKGSGAQNTIVRGKIGSYPANYDTDVAVYNGTGTGTTHSGLSNGDHWYYRAWSYATEGGLVKYSDLYAQADAIPLGIPVVSTNNVTLVEETTAMLNGNVTDNGGDNVTRGFQWDTDLSSPYSDNWSESPYGEGVYDHALLSLNKGDKYIFRAFANNTKGYGYGNPLYFMTKPDGATSFNSTGHGINYIALSWINGGGMDSVTIRYSTINYPSTITYGIQGYTGNGVSANISGLDDNTLYYFSLFTQATENGTTTTADIVAHVTETTDLEPELEIDKFAGLKQIISISGLVIFIIFMTNGAALLGILGFNIFKGKGRRW